MIVRRDKAKEFYKGFVNGVLVYRRILPKETIKPAVSDYLWGWTYAYEEAAMAALDLGFGPEAARRYLAESAGCYMELQERTRGSSADDVVRTFFRIATCHDAGALKKFAAGYLETPEGIRGEEGPRGFRSPDSDDHYWHLANVLAVFYSQDARALKAAVHELASLRPRTGFAFSREWWKEIVPLAVHCLTAARPDPMKQLRAVAEVNQKHFGKDWKDSIYEAWFAEMALAFAAAAQSRGWQVPDEDPHESMPLGLLKLPPIPVPGHPWGELPPIDPELAKAVEEAATGGAKKPAARKPAAGKAAAGKPAAKSASGSKKKASR